MHDIEVLDELMRQLPEGSSRRHEILHGLRRAADAVDPADVPNTAAAARSRLAEVLSRPAHASAHRVSAVGHAHIDSAWLWPVRETVRKCARTFTNMTTLAQEYPELVFACSSAQQYAWMKEQRPEIYARMQKAAAAGSWVPVGGMWVEADGNLPGGEALARQLVYGRRFFAQEFGIEQDGVWLPDSFGYTAAFPQSKKLYDQARAVFPGGVTHDLRYLEPFPVYIDHAKGAHKWAVDGQELIDYFKNRAVWLVEPDERPPKVSPYPGRPAEKCAPLDSGASAAPDREAARP